MILVDQGILHRGGGKNGPYLNSYTKSNVNTKFSMRFGVHQKLVRKNDSELMTSLL